MKRTVCLLKKDNFMRTLNATKRNEPIEIASKLPSQIEPEGATSLREVVAKYMAGVSPHDVKQVYFDYDARLGKLPNLEDMPYIPHFGTFTEAHEWLNSEEARKAEEKAKNISPVIVDTPQVPEETVEPNPSQNEPTDTK